MDNSLTFQYNIKIEDLGVTTIENSFISLYMPQMPGDYVKVYLFGLKACQGAQPRTLNNSVIAESLGLAESDIEDAWQYLKRIGVIDFVYDGEGGTRVSYQQIAAKVLGGSMDTKTPRNEIGADDEIDVTVNADEKRVRAMFDKIQMMLGSKPMSKTAMLTFKYFVTDYGFDPETVCVLVEHGLSSIEKKDRNFTDAQSLKYLKAIAKNWQDKGVVSFEEAEAEIKKRKERTKAYRTVLNYLGFNRNPIQWEEEMIDKWFDDYGFDMNVIDEALSRAATPSVKYVNGILSRWHDKGYKTVEDIKKEQKPRGQNKNTAQPATEDPWLFEQFDALQAESMAEMIEKSKED